MEWPDGNENWSGGSSVAQQCGATGRFRPMIRFNRRNSPTEIAAESVAAPTATNRLGPPKIISMIPSAYQSQPSPTREARTIQMRIHLGGFHPFKTPHQILVATGDITQHTAR